MTGSGRTRDAQARVEVILTLAEAIGFHRLALAVNGEPLSVRRDRVVALRVLERAHRAERDDPPPKERTA